LKSNKKREEMRGKIFLVYVDESDEDTAILSLLRSAGIPFEPVCCASKLTPFIVCGTTRYEGIEKIKCFIRNWKKENS